MTSTALHQVLAEMRAVRADLSQLRTHIDNQSSLAEQRHNELRAELDSLRITIRTGQAEVASVSAKVDRLFDFDLTHQPALKRRRPEFTPTPTRTSAPPLHNHAHPHAPPPAHGVPAQAQAHAPAQALAQRSPTTPALQKPTLWLHRPNDNTPLSRPHPLPPITPITPVVNSLTPAYTPPRPTSVPTTSVSAPVAVPVPIPAPALTPAPTPTRSVPVAPAPAPSPVSAPAPVTSTSSVPVSMAVPAAAKIEQPLLPQPQRHPIVRQGALPIPPPSAVSGALVQPSVNANAAGGAATTGTVRPCTDEPRKGARVFTADDRRVLEDEYDTNKFPSKRHIEELALKLAKPDEKVRTWFNNRRSLDRRSGKLVVRAQTHAHSHQVQPPDEQTTTPTAPAGVV